MTETLDQTLEQLFDAGSRMGQLLAYRKCLKFISQSSIDEHPWNLEEVVAMLIEEEIALLEAKDEKDPSQIGVEAQKANLGPFPPQETGTGDKP